MNKRKVFDFVVLGGLVAAVGSSSGCSAFNMMTGGSGSEYVIKHDVTTFQHEDDPGITVSEHSCQVEINRAGDEQGHDSAAILVNSTVTHGCSVHTGSTNELITGKESEAAGNVVGGAAGAILGGG